MADQHQRSGSYWNSLAGVLTAAGGLIAAVAALLGALAAIGVISFPTPSQTSSPAATTTHETQVTLAVTPSNQSFGSVQIGHASAPISISITNPGQNSTAITTSLEGSNAEDFTVIQDTCRDAIIPSKTTCQTHLQFSPHKPGNKIAQLRISADYALAPAAVTLTGVALPPGSVTFEPTSIVILLTGPSPAAWPTAGTQQLKITNNGPGTLLINTITVDDPERERHFSIGSNNCPTRPLTVGESCMLTVQLKVISTATGIFKASALVMDDAADSPQSIPLMGFRGRFLIGPFPTRSR